MKNYLLVLLSVLAIGFLASSSISDKKADIVPDAGESNEIALLSEKTTLSESKLDTIATTANTAYTTPVYTYTATPVSQATAKNYDYQVTVYKPDFDAIPLSYTDIYKTNKLIYAHNSANLFGNLGTHGVGSTISVNEGGAITTYRVYDVRIFKKTDATTLQLCHNGYNDCTGSHMGNIANAALIDIVNYVRYANYYDVAFMTCTGTNYGNGDASHRLVVYANRI